VLDDCKSADGIDWTPTGFIMQQAGNIRGFGGSLFVAMQGTRCQGLRDSVHRGDQPRRSQ
jgi:hypothetical protein